MAYDYFKNPNPITDGLKKVKLLPGGFWNFPSKEDKMPTLQPVNLRLFAVWTFDCPDGFLIEGVDDPPGNAHFADISPDGFKDPCNDIMLTNTFSKPRLGPHAETGQIVIASTDGNGLDLNTLRDWCYDLCKKLGWTFITLM